MVGTPAQIRPGSAGSPPWHVTHVDETGSTNADLLAAAVAGAPDRSVLVAAHQTAGRGRLDRRWDAPPGANLLVSLLFSLVPLLEVRRVKPLLLLRGGTTGGLPGIAVYPPWWTGAGIRARLAALDRAQVVAAVVVGLLGRGLRSPEPAAGEVAAEGDGREA